MLKSRPEADVLDPALDERDAGHTPGAEDALPRPSADGGLSNTVPDATAARRHFVVNATSNLLYFALSTGVMLWYVPFLVHHLGVAAYGMVALANSLVMYTTVVSDSLNNAIYRYLAIDLNRGDAVAARRTFNSAAALTLAACGALLVPALAVTLFFPVIFDVPATLTHATQFLFASVAATTLVAILGSLFGTSSLIAHRFDLRNIVRAATLLIRVGIVALCFLVWPASLWPVGIGLLVSALVGLCGLVLVWRRLTPQLRFRPGEAERDRVRAFVGLSGWSAVNLLGFLLLTQVDLLIVNAVFGAEMTGRYGSILLIPALVYALAEIVMPMLNPAIMARYAVGDRDGIRRLTMRAVKLLGIGLALPIGLLCGLGEPLLTLWLGPDFASLHLVLALLVGHLTINLALRPLAYVLNAYNKVKVQGIVSLGLGVVNIALAVAMARWSGWGLAGVAAAAALVWTVKNLGFLSVYCATVLGLHWWAFSRPLVAGIVGLFCITLAGRLLSKIWWPADWLPLAGMAAGIAAAYGAVAWVALLNRSDRKTVWNLIVRSSHV